MALLGFSKLLGKDSQKFLPLDKQTNGACGRPIYIDGSLDRKFRGLKLSQMTNIIEKLKTLGASAGGASSYSCVNDASAHMTVIGKTRVTYKIFQSTNDSAKKAGVYITDLDVDSYKGGSPGLYSVSENRGRWELNEKRPQSIRGHFAAINGLCRDPEHAASEILPDMLDQAFNKNRKWEGDLKSEGFDMFFNPPSLYHKGLMWTTPKQKTYGKLYAAKLLKDELISSQRKNRKVQWVIHSDGAKLLDAALKMTGGADLSNHTMLFCSPTEDISNILPNMKRNKIGLHDDVMKIQDDDWKSKTAQMTSGGAIKKELSKFPGFEDKAELFRDSAHKSLKGYVDQFKGAAAMGAGVGTLLLAPAVPGVAAVGGALWGAYDTWNKAKSIRNKAATNLNTSSLNPHMQPFKSTDEMNLMAKKHSGSTLKTFVDVLKEKLI